MHFLQVLAALSRKFLLAAVYRLDSHTAKAANIGTAALFTYQVYSPKRAPCSCPLKVSHMQPPRLSNRPAHSVVTFNSTACKAVQLCFIHHLCMPLQ